MPIRINLSARTLLRIAGADAAHFLQGQITQDVNQLQAGYALLFAHCSPKGRVLFNGPLWKEGDAWWMELPASRGDFALKRLTMYRLRSKVEIEKVATAHWGLLFATEADCAANVTLARSQGLHAVMLSPTRMLVLENSLPTPWSEFTEGTLEDWQLGTLQAGIAEIEEDTADEWIPQMLNWDVLGGISFDKGCYTGQEIVARTHFLGKVKRGLGHFKSVHPLHLNQSLWTDQESAVGKVVMIARNQALAVLQDAAQDATELHLDSPQGPLIERLQA